MKKTILTIFALSAFCAVTFAQVPESGEAEQNVPAKETHPLRITSDAFRSSWCSLTGFNIYLTSVDGQNPEVRVYDKYTDNVLEVPYGRYKIELRRHSQGPDAGYVNGARVRSNRRKNDLAYRGYFTFDENHDSFSRMSYSEDGCIAVLSGNYGLTGMEILSGSQKYTYLADAGFMKFPVWPGFSSNLFRATAFKAADSGADPQYFFSASVLLLNGEQRIGGSVSPHIDVNFLGSYSWMPQLHKKDWSILEGMKFNYVDGYDVFLGVEVTSRVPSLNANFKIGYRLANGHVNQYDKGQESYLSTDYDFKGLSATIGFTFGGRDCKGANTLRVFYL